ncbi:peptidoglycan-binding protein [Actinoplanes sp. NPDC048796]|uniref:peptidoglycan-binding protein n=1 Tax=unclassified Actinoplanes TaxID=2626549 RepID=UPI0033D12FA9
MSARGMLSLVGTAVGGLVGWTATPPPLEPACLRDLLTEIGLTRADVGDAELVEAVRVFQARTGLDPDGVAGPRTVHLLARYAAEARELRLDLAA